MNIGDKIKLLRTSLNLTQEDLAESAGTKKQTIHKYETGIISNIPASKVKAIADKLNTTPAYLMGWSVAEPSPQLSILDKYNNLNNIGKQKAESYIDDLLENPKYTASNNIKETKSASTSRYDRLEIAAYGGEGNKGPKKKDREIT